MVVEMAAGRGSGQGVVGTFGMLSRRVRWLGLMALVASLTLLSYYLVVTGWALGYLIFGLAGHHPGFSAFTAGLNAVWYFLAAAAITAVIVSLGVNRDIEASSTILMPVLLVLVVGLAIYGLTLPGWTAALQFYLAPRPSALLDVTVWIRALGQAFFSVGAGMGVLITYGAYVLRETNLVKSSAVIARGGYRYSPAGWPGGVSAGLYVW
jgi:NSS family neurotransmitter:Na+ symporter